jgi:hypothetical protein
MDYEGGFAYCVDYDNVYVFDVRDPTNIILAEMIGGADMTDIFVNGHIAYISYGNYTNTLSGVGINNVTDPYNWNYLTGINFGTNITAIWVEGTHLYAVDYVAPATYVTSLYCYDIRDFTNIQLVGSRSRLATHLDIYVSGDFAYLSTEKYLSYYNISNPTSFTFEGDLNNKTGQPITSLGVWGYGRNFISASADGVYYLMYDPVTEGFTSSHFSQAKQARQVTIFGDYAFVANTDSLVILRHHYSGSDSFVNDIYQAQSTPVTTLSEGKFISVTLEIDAKMNVLCPTTFYVSADNGTHWEEVVPGMSHVFVYQGQNLKWKIVMKTDQKLSNRFYTLRLDYEYSLPPEKPIINDLGGSSIWGYKKVTWAPAPDDGTISYYVLQVSTDATFSTLYKNYTVTGTSKGVYYMPKGYYHFRVQGIDNTGLIGDWSDVIALDVTFSLLSPMWLGIIGGGLIAIIAIITVSIVLVRKKKKSLPER